MTRMNGTRRAVLITGCSSGIGRAAADMLRERGYRAFATARRPADVERLAADGHESLRLDLTDGQSIDAAVDEMLSRTSGRLYGLFNNGGYGQPGAVEDVSVETLRTQFETNVFGWHAVIRRVLPVMRAAGEGRIVQTSSLLGLVSARYRGAYAASKFAIEGLTDAMRLELRGSGIHISLIEPGPIESRARANAHAAFVRWIDGESSPHRDAYRVAMSRLGDPDAVLPFTLPASAVASKLLHALESPRPKVRYYVTVPTYLFAFLKRALPGRWFDAVLNRLSESEIREPSGRRRR